MAKTKISEFSATPANNTDIDSINIAEGCAPSGINDAIRELMAQLKDFQTGAVGDSFNGPVGTTTAAAGAFTTLAASGAVTLSGGTANGVPYLNGSKVLTSGSALVFDGSNLGLGVTPSAWDTSIRVLESFNGSAFGANTGVPIAYVVSNYIGTSTGAKYKVNGYATRFIANGYQGGCSWEIAPSGTAGNAISFTQAMTLDASGNFLVGTTTAGGTGTTIYKAASGNAGAPGSIHFNGSSAATETVMSFQFNGTAVGSITRSNVATVYLTASDYRLKENVAPMTSALATVAQLKPVSYTWKTDGSNGQGFIAHELQAVVPECVVGEKDAVTESGSIKPQGIDTSFLVATLTAAIQEQQALILTLQADVAALKAAA